jgi:F-type H+-transporting ATPase subunit gamma
MATLREVRARISGVKKTQKITKAMKMVAAAKLRRSQSNVVAARPYALSMKSLLQHLSSTMDLATNPYAVQRDVKAVALVVVTADRGLCGAFNSNLLKAAVNHINTHYEQARSEGRLQLFCVGRKGVDFFSKRGYSVAGKYVGVYNDLVFGRARAIVSDVVRGYVAGEFDKIEIVYNEFKSIARQQIVIEQFLPLPAQETGTTDVAGEPVAAVHYIYEPSSRSIVDALVPKHLNFQMWRVLLESNASEQGARMAAMDNATENANELIESLQLVYNKARQAAITKELLEIVAGAEALKKTG